MIKKNNKLKIIAGVWLSLVGVGVVGSALWLGIHTLIKNNKLEQDLENIKLKPGPKGPPGKPGPQGPPGKNRPTPLTTLSKKYTLKTKDKYKEGLKIDDNSFQFDTIGDVNFKVRWNPDTGWLKFWKITPPKSRPYAEIEVSQQDKSRVLKKILTLIKAIETFRIQEIIEYINTLEAE